MMTYDLHGLWDKGNKWLGAFLNGHTNLTEITTDLDLLWRNHIDPAKVNLGLAFYARTFTMADPSCSEPGCMFVSAGAEGPCTQSVGTLSNAEIADIIAENNLTPVHYADAAVKVVTWGDQWVAYDDGDTFQQKLDFARGECLGGVMVWALSEDSANVASSLSLPDATEANLGGVFLQGKSYKSRIHLRCTNFR
jgi:GH18 family chitinase